MFPDSSHYETYNGSCFMYLSKILNKLQMFKVTNFMTFSYELRLTPRFANFAFKNVQSVRLFLLLAFQTNFTKKQTYEVSPVTC